MIKSILAASSLVLISACTGPSKKSSLSQTAAVIHEVHMTTANKFSPADITINLGDSIKFINDSAGPHTVTADPTVVGNLSHISLPTGAAPFDSDTIFGHDSFVLKLSVVGDYKYTCVPHEFMGMQGQIHVK